MLYELLTGSTPLTRKWIKEVTILEVLRVIREEEPPNPSTRLSESKDSLPSISATAFVDVLAGKTRHFMEEDQTSDEEETFTARHFFALKSGVRKEYEIA